MNIPQLSSFREAFSDAVAHQRVMDEFDKAARRAVDAGAEVLIPCGSHAVLQARRALREIEGALIMDGLAVLIKMAETAIKLHIDKSCHCISTSQAHDALRDRDGSNGLRHP
jgi:hypothetical protein